MDKKRIRDLLIIILAFILCLCCTAFVLDYRWVKDEDIYTKNIAYEREPEESIDVLYFGTSELYTAILPIITYEEEGFTGFNFGVSRKSAMTQYYQLVYALKHQTPRVVVCDFSSLFDGELADENEELYRKIVTTMPDREVKNALIKEILARDKSQEALYWYVPFLRYHGIWSQLTKDNFYPANTYNEEYKDYLKGTLLFDRGYKDEYIAIEPELWEAEPSQEGPTELSIEFYDKFIDLCREKDIEVVALSLPKPGRTKEYVCRKAAQDEYLTSRGVRLYEYSSYEEMQRLELTLEGDYFNSSHLNVNGAVKFTRDFAHRLKADYNLPDRREDKAFKEGWEEPLWEFKSDFQEN